MTAAAIIIVALKIYAGVVTFLFIGGMLRR
jgi:hypothetical protein